MILHVVLILLMAALYGAVLVLEARQDAQQTETERKTDG